MFNGWLNESRIAFYDYVFGLMLNGVYGMRCDYDLGKMWWCVVGELWFLVRGGL